MGGMRKFILINSLGIAVSACSSEMPGLTVPRLGNAVPVAEMFENIPAKADANGETALEVLALAGTRQALSVPADPGNYSAAKWTSIKDPLKLAAEQDPAVSTARADYREALAKVSVARSALRPQSDGGIQVGGSASSSGNSALGAVSSLEITQVVFDGGAGISRVDAAQFSADGAKARLEGVASGVALDAANAWIDYVNAQSRLARNILATNATTELLEKLRRLNESGLADRATLQGAEIDLQTLDIESVQLTQMSQDARVRLSRYYTSIPASTPLIVSPLGESDVIDASTLWKNAPGLRVAAASVLAARDELKSARAAFEPNVDLTAGAQAPLKAGEDVSFNVGFDVKWLFGDGGRRAAQVEAASAKLQSLEDALEAAQTSTQREISGLMARKGSLESSLELAVQQVANYREQRTTAETQISAGTAGVAQLLSVTLQLHQAEARATDLRSEILKIDFSIADRAGILLEWLEVTM
jgi:outer membrane protein TolC